MDDSQGKDGSRLMKKYIIRRILSGILTIFIVFTLTFILIKSAPGDPIRTLIGQDNDAPVLQAALEEKWGLNKSLPEQYFAYLSNAVQGDLGTSIIYERSVNEMISEKVGATVLLGLTSAILALVIGTTLGILAARHEGSAYDTITSVTTYTMNSVPSFWLGLMFIILFSTKLGWLPSYGMTTARKNYEGWAYVVDVMRHMALPILTLTMVTMPKYFRTAKSSVLQVMNEDFITTLRATGMSEKKIFSKYVFRNAILPTITIFGITMAYLITGVSLIEVVFSWPGMGRLVLTAINQRDYPTLQGIYLIMSVSIAVVMILVDIIYAVFDPRIRYD